MDKGASLRETGSREPRPQAVDGPSGFDPARWEDYYAVLRRMRPDGKFADEDEDAAFDLLLAGFVVSEEVKKPCRNCGTPLLDYRYNRLTVAGKLFMRVAAIAMETREGGDVKQAPSRSDDSAAIAQNPPSDPSERNT